mgnify:CR=1 FL=1
MTPTKPPYQMGKVYLDDAGNIRQVVLIDRNGNRTLTLPHLVEVPAGATTTLVRATIQAQEVRPTTDDLHHTAQNEAVDLFPAPGRRVRILGEYVDPDMLNRFYKGMTLDAILASRGFQTAVRELRGCGCYNAVELVLYCGALRALQVVRFARRQHYARFGTDRQIQSLPDFISANIWKGPPQTRKEAK